MFLFPAKVNLLYLNDYIMKKTFLTFALIFSGLLSFAQEKLLSYEDISYLIHNNITKADNFMISKGYSVTLSKPKDKVKKYILKYKAETQNEVTLRPDGRRLFVGIQTNILEQYNLLLNSISQYKTTASNPSPDVQSYLVQDLGNIYITITDSVPYDPLKKDYDIQIVPDKNIVAVD